MKQKTNEPKRPIIGHILYKYFGIETPRYKKYWKRYCVYMHNSLLFNYFY